MSTSGCSSPDAPAATWTLGMPVLLKAAFGDSSMYISNQFQLQKSTTLETKATLE
jgi:hypothetical protein